MGTPPVQSPGTSPGFATLYNYYAAAQRSIPATFGKMPQDIGVYMALFGSRLPRNGEVVIFDYSFFGLEIRRFASIGWADRRLNL